MFVRQGSDHFLDHNPKLHMLKRHSMCEDVVQDQKEEGWFHARL